MYRMRSLASRSKNTAVGHVALRFEPSRVVVQRRQGPLLCLPLSSALFLKNVARRSRLGCAYDLTAIVLPKVHLF